MSATPPTPWYRRPVSKSVPMWLLLAASVATASCLGAVYLGGFTPGVLVQVFAIGFFAGLVLCVAVGARLVQARSTAANPFRPPAWIAVPVTAAVMVLVAYGLIDEVLRQGYFDGYRRRRGYYVVPGPLAIGIGCCFLAGAGLVSFEAALRRPRMASPFVGGLLGLVVLVVGLCMILARVWGRAG